MLLLLLFSPLAHPLVHKVRRVPKHPKIIVTRATATVQAEPTAWAMARTIEKMEPVCKAKAHGVMDNVAFFGAGFSAGQMTGGVENGPSALLEAGLGEAVGNLGKVWCWEDLWFPAVSKAGLCGQPARPKRLVGRGC